MDPAIRDRHEILLDKLFVIVWQWPS